MIVNKFIKFVIFSALTIVLSILVAQFGPTPQEASADDSNITGWMWSDNIGWVSLTCDNTTSCGSSAYGINQDSDGDWQGYGWSDTVGWIQFDSGCPSGSEGQCGSKMISNNLRGWARFCAGSSDGACGSSPRPDGWDGWVSLSSTNDHNPGVAGIQTSAFSYGPTQSGVQVTGYAWGSTVVGWTQMVDVTVNQAAQSTLRLVASETVPTAGTIAGLPSDLYTSSQAGTVVLSWYTTDAAVSYTSCTGSSVATSNNWDGMTLDTPQVLPGFEYRSNVAYNLNNQNPSIFTINCTRTAGGSDSATAQVYQSQDCVVNLSGGGGYCASGPNQRTPQLTWTATNAVSCDAAWFTGQNAIDHPTSGTQDVGAGSYQVTCVTQGTGALCTSGTENVFQLPANDPQCTVASSQCSDGIDNDLDGQIDYPDDTGCTSVADNSETGGVKVIED